jgi:hypothetical protein
MDNDRATTVYMSPHKLCVHPKNPNEMTDEVYEKLLRNIKTTKRMPPIIARSLELTEDFIEERDAGLIQILDGAHRRRVSIDIEEEEVEVRVWSGVTDVQAYRYLLTLNHGGKDNRKKRHELITSLLGVENDPSTLALTLPETEAQIDAIISETNREDIEDASERAREITEREPVTFFMLKHQSATLRKAIKAAMASMDSEHQEVDCEEGEALMRIAGVYLESTGDDS